jgi:hypothetical protein
MNAEQDFPAQRRTGITSKELCSVLGVLGIVVILIALVSPGGLGDLLENERENASVLAAHNLSVALFSYAIEHTNTYPIGEVPNSSTSTFQLLLDQKYIEDPWEAYLNGVGKKPYSGPKPPILKPENVAWDYMDQIGYTPLTGTTPLDTPVLISTGLGPVALVDGSNTVPVPKSAIWGSHGVTIAYFDQSSRFIRSHVAPLPLPGPPAQLAQPAQLSGSAAFIAAESSRKTVVAVGSKISPAQATAATAPSAAETLVTKNVGKDALLGVINPAMKPVSAPPGTLLPLVRLTPAYYKTEGGNYLTVQP